MFAASFNWDIRTFYKNKFIFCIKREFFTKVNEIFYGLMKFLENLIKIWKSR